MAWCPSSSGRGLAAWRWTDRCCPKAQQARRSETPSALTTSPTFFPYPSRMSASRSLAMISSGRKPLRGTRPSLVEPGPSLTSARTNLAGKGQYNNDPEFRAALNLRHQEMQAELHDPAGAGSCRDGSIGSGARGPDRLRAAVHIIKASGLYGVLRVLRNADEMRSEGAQRRVLQSFSRF